MSGSRLFFSGSGKWVLGSAHFRHEFHIIIQREAMRFPPIGGNAMTDHDIVFMGGDMRMVYAAERMSVSRGCALAGFDILDARQRRNIPEAGTAARYGAAVLPVLADGVDAIRCPYSGRTYDINVLSMLLTEGAAVFAGKVTKGLIRLCAENGYTLYDYLVREEFAVNNAVLTAEGAVGIAVYETGGSIFGSSVMILGFGRIGKLCARYFSALGADVSVAARKKEALAWIGAYGYRAVDLGDERALCETLGKAGIIINTIPAKVLAGTRTEAVQSDAVLIELASQACTDGSARFRIIQAGGLPGKTAPEAAGRIIADTVGNILEERSLRNGGA